MGIEETRGGEAAEARRETRDTRQQRHGGRPGPAGRSASIDLVSGPVILQYHELMGPASHALEQLGDQRPFERCASAWLRTRASLGGSRLPITDKGQAISHEEMHAATKAWRAGFRAKRLGNRAVEGDEVQNEADRDGAPPVERLAPRLSS